MSVNDYLPLELDCSSLANEWPKWKDIFMAYMISSGRINESELIKIATFLLFIGNGGVNIYKTLFPNDHVKMIFLGVITTGDAVVTRTLNDVLHKFEQHCLSQRNVAKESYKFNMISQKACQSFEGFETELRTQIRLCDFKCSCGEMYDNRMLRDRIIEGVYDKKLQQKLLDSRDESLERIIEMCKTYEKANENEGTPHATNSMINVIKEDEDQVRQFTGNKRKIAEIEDVDETLHNTPQKRPKMISATPTREIRSPVEVVHVDDEAELTLHGLQQHYVKLKENNKNKKLFELLDVLEFNQVIIFVKYAQRCVDLVQLLTKQTFPAIDIHSDMGEEERLNRYQQFKDFQKRILVTNLLGRDVDIKRVNVFFNYDMPDDSDTYLHIVAPDGDFCTKCLAITFVSDEADTKILNEVEGKFDGNITELPDEIDLSSYIEGR